MNRYATMEDLRASEERLSTKIIENSGKSLQTVTFVTMLLGFVAVVAQPLIR